MSAKNWRECPQCIARSKSKRQLEIDDAASQYGKIDHVAFNDRMNRAKHIPVMPSDLSEYYDIGIWDGKFQMRYNCHCRKCGFEVRQKMDAPITITEE